MIRNVCKDINILNKVSSEMKEDESFLLDDLLDTLNANRAHCVGMALNMIGVLKRGIVYIDEKNHIEKMINPVIIKKEEPYLATEGCLSLVGTRQTTRYKKIKVEYLNDKFQKRIKNFEGWTAEIIQHEIDHLDGIII